MSRRLYITFLGIAVVALVAVGCGSSDDSPSKAEFTKQANLVCQKNEEKREKDVEAFVTDAKGSLTKSQEEELVATVGVPSLEDLASELGALEAPSDDEEQVKAIVASVEGAAEDIKAEPLSAFNSEEPFAEFKKLSGDYGLKGCSDEI